MEVNYEKLLQDSNQMKNYIKSDVAKLEIEHLTKKASPKKWSALEVIEHLNKVYNIYMPLFNDALENAKYLKEGEFTERRSTLLGRLSIYSMRPKNKKRRFKMKTFDFFRPVISPDKPNGTIETFLRNKESFNDLMRKARTKDLERVKMPTSLGERVKFYVPECFEFILAHEERHMVQIEEALK